MRQARVIRYLVAAALLLLLAACANFPSMRSSMPPPPAETAPGSAAAPAPAPAPDLAQQEQNLEARVQQLESRVADLEGRKGAPAPAKERAVPAPSTPGSPKPAVLSAAAEKHYTEGMRLYHAKKYGEARQQLHQYLKNQPLGLKAPEARYYLADSFYQEGKYQEAGVEFNKLRLQFPKSILAPAGLLRQALCYKNQQQMSAYRNTLQKLVKAYPNSPEAKEAQKVLKESPKDATR
ncbi:MAG: tetratricopeptide repeat protein [Deltaproteobacteria bacterium]|nr:tetratricopeptide repeat protein [Deltaproteobacteria bacterium]MBM4300037.1 tetratricopeptide repeat protein [Deltaproteobacteria bacterium]